MAIKAENVAEIERISKAVFDRETTCPACKVSGVWFRGRCTDTDCGAYLKGGTLVVPKKGKVDEEDDDL